MIIVYIRIEKDCIVEFSHAWAPQMFTLAAASLLAEEIEWKTLTEVLSWNYAYMQSLGFEVSPRRRRSAVSALLAVRNAIHIYRKDGLYDTYSDIL
jgi:NifU-like protein involved in Fe-S cluster formation